MILSRADMLPILFLQLSVWLSQPPEKGDVKRHVVAIIGDGSMSGGLAFEAEQCICHVEQPAHYPE